MTLNSIVLFSYGVRSLIGRVSISEPGRKARMPLTSTVRPPLTLPEVVPVTNSPDSRAFSRRSEEHTSELQSQSNLVCRLLLEKKKNRNKTYRQFVRHARPAQARQTEDAISTSHMDRHSIIHPVQPTVNRWHDVLQMRTPHARS